MRARRPVILLSGLVVLALLLIAKLLLDLAAVDQTPRDVDRSIVEAEARPAISAPEVPSGPAPNAAADDRPGPALPEARAPGTRRIAGRVLRVSDGTALPDATVIVAGTVATHASSAAAADSAEASSVHLPQATTRAADGAFELSDVSIDARQLEVNLPRGWPRQPLLVDLPPGADDVTDLTITFDSGFIVRGTVRDLRGAPVIGAAVDAGTLKSAFADAQGEYVLKDVAPWPGVRAIECSATAVHFEEQSQPLAVPGAPSDVVTADFTLAGLGALEGTLTDTSGQALPDVDVWTLARRSDSLGRTLLTTRHAVSDATGHYRVERLCEGLTDVHLGSVTFDEDEAFSIWHLDLDRTADAAAVEAQAAERKRDDDRLTGLIKRVMAWNERGLATRDVPELLIQAGETTLLDAVLDGGARIEGRVTDAEGKPVEGASVFAVVRQPSPDQRMEPTGPPAAPIYDTTHDYDYESVFELSRPGERWAFEAIATSDAQGHYALEHLSPGWKMLEALPPFTKPSRGCLGTSRPIEVPATADLRDADVVLPARSLKPLLEGRVQDPGGAPIDGALAHLSPIHDAPGAPAELVAFRGYRPREDVDALSEHGGQLAIFGAAPGPYAMELAAPGFITLHDTLTIPGPERVWVLQPSLDLHVTVEDAMTHARVIHFELIARNPDELDRWRAGDAGLGRLRVERNADVPCDVTVTAEGYFPQTLRGAVPSATNHDHPLRFVLQPQF